MEILTETSLMLILTQFGAKKISPNLTLKDCLVMETKYSRIFFDIQVQYLNSLLLIFDPKLDYSTMLIQCSLL